jgi:hypothetical protein
MFLENYYSSKRNIASEEEEKRYHRYLLASCNTISTRASWPNDVLDLRAS